MIENQIDNGADPAGPQRRREISQILVGAQIRSNRVEILHGVPAVIVTLTWCEQRHHMQVGHAQIGEMVEPLPQPLQRGAVAVDVAGVPEHVGALKPIGLQEPALVQTMEVVGAFGETLRCDGDEIGGDRVGLVVQGGDSIVQVGPPLLESELERLAPMGGHAGENVPHLRSHDCIMTRVALPDS